MKAKSKTIGMAIGVVLIIAIFTGVVLSSRGQAISSEISGNSEGGAALSLANTEDTEIIINELASEIPETGFFALGPDNYHEYTKEELFDYYGIEFDISSVFPDMRRTPGLMASSSSAMEAICRGIISYGPTLSVMRK